MIFAGGASVPVRDWPERRVARALVPGRAMVETGWRSEDRWAAFHGGVARAVSYVLQPQPTAVVVSTFTAEEGRLLPLCRTSRQRWETVMNRPPDQRVHRRHPGKPGHGRGCDAAMDGWREQEARNEAGFRDQNEARLGARHALMDGAASLIAFVCECGDGRCEVQIALTVGEYEAVRHYATRFALAPNHENPEAEFVVCEHDLFTVVEKIEAPCRRIVRETDPRSRPKEMTR